MGAASATQDRLIATGILSRREVRAALRYYTSRRMYLAAVAAGGARIDLNGNGAGEVSPEQAAWGRKKLDEIDAKTKSKTTAAVTRKARHEAAPPPAPVQRDGIAALRVAAAARHAVASAEPRDKLRAYNGKERCRMDIAISAHRERGRDLVWLACCHNGKAWVVGASPGERAKLMRKLRRRAGICRIL
jgi:sRNA-binding protein